MRHVVVMTATGSVGLVAIFVVDLLSLLYISWLGEPGLTAGVGLATIVLFLAVSINVGLMIAVGALVSRALGAGESGNARRLAVSSCTHAVIAGAAVTLVLLPLLPRSSRSSGRTTRPSGRPALPLDHAAVELPDGPRHGVFRRPAGGRRRQARHVCDPVGGVVTAGLDPLLIFGFGLGINGAAIAIVCRALIFVPVGYWGAVAIHRLVARPAISATLRDARPLFAIALPAILTNVATPIAAAW